VNKNNIISFFNQLRKSKRLLNWFFLSVIVFLQSSFVNASEAILQENCVSCHTIESTNPLKLSRISHQRKTPEAWLMTLVRMQTIHGLKITSDDQASLVKYLADTQGISPAESQPYRYVLERRLNYSEQKQPELGEMCARCHSEARVGLQRREQAEWAHLVNFHLGQWPSTEFSAMGRDRNWFEVALNEVVPFLGKKYPFNTSAWTDWSNKAKPEVSGRWRIVGDMPSKGEFHGEISLISDNESAQKDAYKMTFNGQFNNGEVLKGTGKVLMYTGFEWRGSLTVSDNAGKRSYQQVFAISENGSELSGRMFVDGHEEFGLNIHGVPGDASEILSVSPRYIKMGEQKIIAIRGANLTGDVLLADGLTIVSEVARSEDEIIIKVKAGQSKVAYASVVTVGQSHLENAITVYDRIATVKVAPNYAIARVGGGGGSTERVSAAFNALVYAAGADDKAGTDDDIYIGVMPAAWNVLPFDQQAIDDKDVDFAGVMNSKTGVFTPGVAGPNPARKYGTNNAGHLTVVANITQGKHQIKGLAELMVTVQRWNNPPIR
jgi:quinohemoprotein amine dehydrogenase